MTEREKWENIFLEDCAEYDKKIKGEIMTEEQKAEELAWKLVEKGCVAVEENKARQDIKHTYLKGYHEGFKDCAKARLNVTTISDCTIKDRWYYTKDCMPEEEKEYLVYSEEWGYEIRKFFVDVGYFECRQNDNIIKWKEIE